jgi:hypothetical protein
MPLVDALEVPVPATSPELLMPLPLAIAPLEPPEPAAVAPLPGPVAPFRSPLDPAGLPEPVPVLVDASPTSPVDVADVLELQPAWLPTRSAAHTTPQNSWLLDMHW